MVNFFIDRPIFSSVLAIIMVLAGSVCMFLLPIAQFPPIAPPQVVVSSTYAGASAKVVADSVTTPIEQQVNGVEGMSYMSSVSANDGSSTLTVTFNVGYPLDIAAVDVQNRVDRATPQLPDTVTHAGVVTAKKQPNFALIIALVSPHSGRDELFMSNYAYIQIVDELKRLPGVGDVTIFGEKRYAIRIWLDPEKLSKLGLTATDVQNAVTEQNTQVAAGQFGAPPAPKGQPFQYQINTLGRLSTPAQFSDIVLRASGDGSVVRIGDVGRVELGAASYASTAQLDGQPAINLAIFQLPGANALDVSREVHAKMAELAQRFPSDMRWEIDYDTTMFVSASVNEVIHTLVIAMILVFLVVYVFLQSWRVTLIPAITIPVSLIGTFAIMEVAGFSINTLSLLGMVLAIGLVVDDAIVVVENVERQLANGLKPLAAAKAAMAEVTGPIIATTLVLGAVFVPVAFIPGISGRLYNQFALTIAISVGLSAINSLTLSPALCAILLRHEGAPRFWFFKKFNSTFERISHGYERSVGTFVRWRWAVLGCFAGLIAVMYMLLQLLPTAFLPTEDQGYFFIPVSTPDGASLERTSAVLDQVRGIAAAQNGVAHTIVIGGYNFLTGSAQSSAGVVFVILKPWDERGAALATPNIIRATQGRLFGIKDGLAFAVDAPPIQGLSATGGFEFELQDPAGNGTDALGAILQTFLARARQRPEVAGLFTTFSTRVPQIYLDVDRVKAKLSGLALPDVFNTLQVFLGSYYVNDFNLFGRVFQVILEAEQTARQSPSDLSKIYVRNTKNQMIPIDTLAKVRQIVGPETVPHYNLYGSALINGSPAPGYSSGQATLAMEEVAKEVLIPAGFGYSWTGVTYEQEKAGNVAPMIFGLALVFVFLFLAAQYESWALPFVVLLAVPLAVLGAALALWLRGRQLDVYGEIGLVMLIGLAAKNAILITEFAKRRREEGLGIIEATMEAARLRLRPILMTAFAFILGVVPLAVATGAGAASRQSIGTAVLGGMLAATFLTLVFVPVFFYLAERLREHGTPPVSASHPEVSDRHYGPLAVPIARHRHCGRRITDRESFSGPAPQTQEFDNA